MPKSSLPTPTSVALPPAPTNYSRTIYEVQQGTGNDAQAIQTAINNAVSGGTTNPVVHLPMGTYNITQTITIPANAGIQVVGDGGAGQYGSQLNWTGTGSGPVMDLQGPSRATLRDLAFNGCNDGINEATALQIDNANQTGGQIYAEEMNAGGVNDSHIGTASFDVNGVEDATITFVSPNIGDPYTDYGGIVTGGPKEGSGRTGQWSGGPRHRRQPRRRWTAL